jgi:hypothetical protein
MRNTILPLVAVGSLTFVALTPALATGLCSEYPNLNKCPIDGVYGNPTSRPSSYQTPPRHVRHAQHVRYRYNG